MGGVFLEGFFLFDFFGWVLFWGFFYYLFCFFLVFVAFWRGFPLPSPYMLPETHFAVVEYGIEHQDVSASSS